MRALHTLRAEALPLLAKVLVTGILLITFYNVETFSASTDDAVNTSFSADADVDLYGLIDDLRDPDAFSAFRDSVPDLDRLAAFYSALSDDDELAFLSSFDQPVPIQDFRGGSPFEEGYGTDAHTRGPYLDERTGRETLDVKALQINREAYEFYRLTTSTPTSLPWAAIDYDAATTPLLLGSDYEGVYDIGDTVRGTLYFKEVTFEVAGFLEPSSSIFYHDDIDFFLDDYIVIPYPERLPAASEATKDFAGILAFAMINGDIAAPKHLSADDVIARLSSLATATGFDEYTLLNVSSYLVQYTLTKRVIDSNLGLVLALEVAVAAASLVAIHFLDRFLFARRTPRLLAAWLAGCPPRRLFAQSLRPVLIAHGGVVVLLAAAYGILPQHDPYALRPVLLAGAVVLLLDIAHHRALLARLIRTESRGSRRP
ncbi:hypothetical protein AS850_11390 [Frondihabitans sp. 762G35]|uniref:hypothetical protein n=1 Tax=Frondihabitans sp. 762G35 TaxID=1446794 RepID=UPI000D227F6F|nr:hypothetical protein [Frondihabitans sp. 762G35]ARC57675.1 hypothetical protein AS850_11390 [Frondihabitans sp. 762G35]